MDGVQMAVIANRLDAVVASMMNTIFRSSRSGVLNSAHDFSCCIITAEHELVMGAESLPIHMMSGPDLISCAVAQAHPAMRRGDAFLHNSPYNGNSHPADHSLLVPVIDDEGRHRFSVLAKAHQADCGNSQPTTYMASATDAYNEGSLLFDATQVQRDYSDVDDILRMCRLRIRVPAQWWGDYLALLGAVRVGERRLLELGDELGWDTLERFTSRWFDYSEQSMQQAIARLVPGTIEAATHHDPFPGAPDGVEVRARVEIDTEGQMIRVDLRDNVDCLPNGLNLTVSTARTAAMVGVFNSIGAEVPPNAGSFRRIGVELRRNCAVGEPVHPHSCSAATTNLADRVANVVQRAIAELSEGVGLAECGPCIPAAAGVISGIDPRHGRPFVNQIFLAVTGGAGSPWGDGWLTLFHVGCGGMLRRDSIEIAESSHPLLVTVQKLLPDTEGAGAFRGAPSAYVEYGPVDTDMIVAYGSDGAENPALGARDGLPGGATQHYRLTAQGEEREALPSMGLIKLAAGERIVSVTAAGGGYGSPRSRDPEAVRRDVAEGWIGLQRAREVYGVAIDSDGRVDAVETATLRDGAERRSGVAA